MRRTWSLLSLAAFLFVAVGAAQGASQAPPGDRPQPPSSPEEAKALAASKQPLEVSVRRASAAEARAAAREAGADTEGSLPSDIGVFGNTRTAAVYCWSGTITGTWGIWPYQQKVYDHTYWCANYGSSITYRSTNVTHGSTLCSGNGDYSFRYSGGLGYTYVAIEAGAYFNCPTTIPWININRHDWLHDYYNVYGNLIVVGQSG